MVFSALICCLKPYLIRDIFKRALKALGSIHAFTRIDHGRCGQLHVSSHAFESRSGFYSQALYFEHFCSRALRVPANGVSDEIRPNS